MSVSVQKDDFDISAEVAALTNSRTDIGAVVTFTGVVRGTSGGEPLSEMVLEHYPGMTEARRSSSGSRKRPTHAGRSVRHVSSIAMALSNPAIRLFWLLLHRLIARPPLTRPRLSWIFSRRGRPSGRKRRTRTAVEHGWTHEPVIAPRWSAGGLLMIPRIRLRVRKTAQHTVVNCFIRLSRSAMGPVPGLSWPRL